MENFRDVAAAGEERGILARVDDAAGLGARELAAGARRAGRRRGAGRPTRARFVEENRGAADRTAAAVLALLARRRPRPGARA